MTQHQFCTTERDGHLLTIMMNRPERMNAIHPQASQEMAQIFDDFLSDDNLWVAIISGSGERAFSAGNDLRFQAEQGGERITTPESGFAGLTSRQAISKPIIAAVNGVAMGGGFEIALACDIIIASDKAIFALPEPHVGLAALAGGLHRLPRQIGLKQAMGMILTGRRVSAQEGYDLGFVTKIVPHDDLMKEARAWADMILSCSPISVRTSKSIINKGLEHASLQEAMAQNYPEIIDLLKSEDAKEGPLAFAEKRPPKWSGK